MPLFFISDHTIEKFKSERMVHMNFLSSKFA